MILNELMIQVDVALPSGDSQKLSIQETSTVGELRSLAQKSFAKGVLKLVTAEHEYLTEPL